MIPNSICCIPQWPYLLDSFGHPRVGCVWRLCPALHPPKHRANALNCASHLLWMGGYDRRLTKFGWEGLTYFIAKDTHHAKLVLLESIAKWHHQTRYHQGSNNHPIKVLHRFPGSPLQVGFPKAETKSALAWNINLILLRLETFITICFANIWIYTFCILKWMDLRHSLFVLDCQILSVWGPKTLPTQPTRLIREWNNFNMFRIARTLVVSVKFSSSLLDISSWR